MHKLQQFCRQLLDYEGDVEGNHVLQERVTEQNEMLDTGEVLVCFGDGQHVCLVEPIGTVRRNM
jgi:hypothetical protein